MAERLEKLHQVTPRHHKPKRIKGNHQRQIHQKRRRQKRHSFGIVKGRPQPVADPRRKAHGKHQGNLVQQHEIQMFDPAANRHFIHSFSPLSSPVPRLCDAYSIAYRFFQTIKKYYNCISFPLYAPSFSLSIQQQKFAKKFHLFFSLPTDDNSAVEIGAVSCYDTVNHRGWRLLA